MELPEGLQEQISMDDFYKELAGSLDGIEEKPARRGRGRPRKQDVPPSDMAGKSPEPVSIDKKITKREQKLRDFYNGIAFALMSTNTVAGKMDGAIIAQGADARASEVAKLCKQYPEFGHWVDRFLEGNVWVSFVLGHGGMLLAIAMVHGLVPADLFPRLLSRIPGFRTTQEQAA